MRLWLTALLTGALTVGLLTLCFPPFNLGWLAWIALVPAMLLVPRLSIRGAEWFGFLTGLGFYAIGFRWMATIFGFPAVALWSLLALYIAAFIALARSLPETLSPQKHALLLAMFWVALEFIRAEQWPLRFTWLSLGTSQHNQPVLQAASWVGMYGLSFLLVLVNGGIAASIRKRSLLNLAAFAFLPLLTLLSPATLLAWKTVPAPAAVILIQSPSTSISEMAMMSDGVVRYAGPKSLVVWPEYVVQWTPEEDPGLLEDLGAMSRKWDATTVIGGVTGHSGDAFSSAALVFASSGKYQGAYEKHSPIPLFQDGLPGTTYPLFQWETGSDTVPFGTVICYDMSFEPHVRRLAAKGAQLIVVPSRDDISWGRVQHLQHSIMAPLRAVENRRTIVRAAESGESQVVGPNGRVIDSLEIGVEGALMRQEIPLATGRTFYNRAGWLIPWICQVVAAAWLVSRLFQHRQRRLSANVDDIRVVAAN